MPWLNSGIDSDMNKEVMVKFKWVGGKDVDLPAGAVYSTLAKISGDNRSAPISDWSISVEFPNGHKGNNTTIAKASFLVDDAPEYLLVCGTKIDFYEGQMYSATAEVL